METCLTLSLPAVDLVKKYNVPVPRYTSYPTVPFWGNSLPAVAQWQEVLLSTFSASNQQEGISLYIHLPFCESLCTYCGCNKRITKNHGVEPVYLKAVLQEWGKYLALFPQKPIIREIHLGGGTPTFFSPENLQYLINGILAQAEVHPQHEFSFEGHPNNTTAQHLQALYDVGFRRVSYGVQDLSEKVQKAINRLQPLENLVQATQLARQIGYTSVNYDLIYGLPFQNPASMEDTFRQVIGLKPDRIAYYSYAHVPWKEKSQRHYSEADLPSDSDKLALYTLGQTMLSEAGYEDVGMDHFAFPQEELCVAQREGRLHRNFMGYTTNQTHLMVGLGVSSISDLSRGYLQNVKTVEEYYALLAMGEWPLFKGYLLTQEDAQMRRHILDIACNGKTNWQHSPGAELIREQVQPVLQSLAADGLIELGKEELVLTSTGLRFLRSVCAAFDLYLKKGTNNASAQPMFSKAV
ncbi:oxygen-independent coproporphyrinogen III oxidase [Rufibacter glacialis]|uniref:Coproporphyrinogen-III oxidase n=1 Tax=Rufibacter glacialis TaxID=1259555 RepID=A0A5M8QE50_9BACT|nr:oxygen-independent coproporphyrinogen III oxidase [Rufibacter glacialis]KAA6433200.1 oxygen-independent coproporphyrinogen III oxidase [Rufibacter glacialis]GGK76524.1 coproporphyrinogen-III oxidase [Rufibacter glacialis]